MNNLSTPATYEGSPIATSLQSGGRGYSHRKGCKKGGSNDKDDEYERFAPDDDAGYNDFDGLRGGTRRRRRKHSKKSRKGGKSRKTRRRTRKGRKH